MPRRRAPLVLVGALLVVFVACSMAQQPPGASAGGAAPPDADSQQQQPPSSPALSSNGSALPADAATTPSSNETARPGSNSNGTAITAPPPAASPPPAADSDGSLSPAGNNSTSPATSPDSPAAASPALTAPAAGNASDNTTNATAAGSDQQQLQQQSPGPVSSAAPAEPANALNGNTTEPQPAPPPEDAGHINDSVPNESISAENALRMDAQLAQLLLLEQIQAAFQVSGSELGTFQAIFDLHNNYRIRHQANLLSWSSTLASGAAAWASRCTFSHDPNRAGGENIYVTTSRDVATALSNAIQSWYAEVSSYDFNTGGVRAGLPWNTMIGHFTQAVWHASNLLGCGYQICSYGITNFQPGTIIVCRYYTAGNVAGQYLTNVRPATSSTATPPAVLAPAPAPTTSNLAVLVAQTGQPFIGPGCRNSPNKAYWLCVWDAGEALLYSGNTPTWRTGTTGRSAGRPYRLVVWSDGNIYLNNAYSQFLWQSGTGGRSGGPFRLLLQDDGRLVLYDANNARIWSRP